MIGTDLEAVREMAVKKLALLSLLLLGLGACVTRDAEYWFNRGVNQERGSDYFSDIADYTKAIELKPDYIAAYNNRGHAYILKGRFDEAFADLNKAIELEPDYHLAYYNRGRVYKIKGKNKLAIKNFTKAIGLELNFAGAYDDRGLAYGEAGLYDKAIADATKAIALLEAKGDRHNMANSYNNRADIHLMNGVHDRMIADINKAIELVPEFAWSYGHLAWERATSPEFVYRDGKQAPELAEKALDIRWSPCNLNARAAAYAELGDFAGAVKWQLRVIDLLKRWGHERFMADFEKHLVRYRTRKPWRENDLEHGPDLAATALKLSNRAERFQAGGKYTEAEPLYGQALGIREKALGPHREDVANTLDKLAMLYRAGGKPAKAGPFYKRSVAIREEMRRRETAGKRELRQKIEALSGRYTTSGGVTQWDVSFRDYRFQVFYLQDGTRTLEYDGSFAGALIKGHKHHTRKTLSRQSPTTLMTGLVDLDRKSFELFWGEFKVREMVRNKICVSRSAEQFWTRSDGQ
jgi:tetratricopeptide (TPR) repeat protein